MYYFPGRLRRVQRPGPDGQRRLPGEAQVRHRRRQPAVLPLQLAVSRYDAGQDRPGAAVRVKKMRQCWKFKSVDKKKTFFVSARGTDMRRKRDCPR